MGQTVDINRVMLMQAPGYFALDSFVPDPARDRAREELAIASLPGYAGWQIESRRKPR